MADGETATLTLKASLLTICGAVFFSLFAIIMLSLWTNQALVRGGEGLWSLVPAVAVLAFIGFQTYQSLKGGTVVLSPEGISVAVGRRVETAPWSDVQEIRLGRISRQRGRTMGVAIKRRTGGGIKLHDFYDTGREEVFRFLSDYARVHAPHVVIEKERGFFDFG